MSSNSDKNTRIAIVSADRCKPSRCKQECRRSCPVVRTGKQCIEVTAASSIAFISENLCIGCGICVKKCPFDAITIINLPTNLESEVSMRFSANSFKLHRLPMPRPGQVLGLVGSNGIGKSTALKILSGKIMPNLGKFDNPPTWPELLVHYRGSELQNYFQRMLDSKLKAIIKPQYVDNIPRAIKGPKNQVGQLLSKDSPSCRTEDFDYIIDTLQLSKLGSREVAQLSGGELQRFAIGMAAAQKADVYMFDEPSSYLDVKQRLHAANIIRSTVGTDNYVICVEHDLSVLDYLSDFICILYGVPSVYGVVSLPASVREGINMFLDGNIPTENMRFRADSLQFRLIDAQDEEVLEREGSYKYPDMKKQLGDFKLSLKSGHFSNSEIIVMMGENGTGKTTFCRMLAGGLAPDNGVKMPELSVSMKPQKIAPKFKGTVRQLFFKRIKASFLHPQFQTDVCKPLRIDDIIDQEVQHLSGGELQRVAIVMTLGVPADVYVIDEPSAYLDSEQRVICSKVIRRFIMHAKKTAFIVEHDFIMATYLADRVIVFEGEPGVNAHANSPESLPSGCNRFLKNLEVTFRRDANSFRPRINKLGSQIDQEQKAAGNYFFLETAEE